MNAQRGFTLTLGGVRKPLYLLPLPLSPSQLPTCQAEGTTPGPVLTAPQERSRWLCGHRLWFPIGFRTKSKAFTVSSQGCGTKNRRPLGWIRSRVFKEGSLQAQGGSGMSTWGAVTTVGLKRQGQASESCSPARGQRGSIRQGREHSHCLSRGTEKGGGREKQSQASLGQICLETSPQLFPLQLPTVFQNTKKVRGTDRDLKPYQPQLTPLAALQAHWHPVPTAIPQCEPHFSRPV